MSTLERITADPDSDPYLSADSEEQEPDGSSNAALQQALQAYFDSITPEDWAATEAERAQYMGICNGTIEHSPTGN